LNNISIGFFIFKFCNQGVILMKKLILEDSFWSLFPNAKIGIIVCQGIDNSIKDREQYGEMILEAEKEALKNL
jgi:DNA/RNA-binding domain of Phe-tRNA-synthetase-like protein